jgi:transposase
MTFIAALRYDRISAPWVNDGPINGELFTLYVEKVLAPTLAKGEIVILDNLGSHKGKPARNAIRAKGAHLLFLPPYSPDLNPIEQVFAKLKHLIRAAESHATSRQPGERSANSSISSPTRSAPTTSKTQGMFPYKSNMLWDSTKLPTLEFPVEARMDPAPRRQAVKTSVERMPGRAKW